jgi:O-antigen/teichoic acid export membrane protein
MANPVKQIISLFTAEGGRSRYIKNTSWLLGARAIQMLVAFFIGAWLARYLGPEQFGIYNYVISFVAIFSALSTLGIGTIMVRDMLHQPEKQEVLLGTSLFLRITGSLGVSLIIILIGWITKEEAAIRYFLFLASLQPIARSLEVITFYFQAKVLSKYTVLAQLISLGIISGLKIYFILNDFSLVWFFWLLALDSLITGFLMTQFYRSQGQKIFKWRIHRQTGRQLISESWPLIFSGMFTTIYLKIDQVMLGNMMDDASVGWYAAAVKISEAWLTIPWIISGSLYPALVNSFQVNRELFRLRVQQLYIILISAGLIVVLPVVIFSEFIIRVIFTSVYDNSADVLRIHIMSSLFIFLGSLSNRWLILEKIQKFWMINSVLGAVSNILLNLLLIPPMGIIGAALATLISYAIAYHIAYIFHPKTRMIFHEQNKSFLRTVAVLPALRIMRKSSESGSKEQVEPASGEDISHN